MTKYFTNFYVLKIMGIFCFFIHFLNSGICKKFENKVELNLLSIASGALALYEISRPIPHSDATNPEVKIPFNFLGESEIVNSLKSSPVSRVLSDSIALAILSPIPLMALNAPHEFWQHLLVYTNAHLLTAGITQFTKYTFTRPRPDQSDDLSFFSGHSSASFVFSTYSVLWGLDHCTDYKIWCVSVPILWSTAISASRLFEHKHHFSDVFIGASLGSFIAYISYKSFWQESQQEPRQEEFSNGQITLNFFNSPPQIQWVKSW